MAVLLKEASPADEVPARPPKSDALAPPFDVVTYAGPITMEGYEQLSTLLEERRKNDEVLVVLETPGGDPHAAFRIARALGCHYERVEALVSRCCKSAGTLIVLGASVLHMDDRGELGPLDMQVRRVNDFARHGSALEVSDTMSMLWTHQLLSFAAQRLFQDVRPPRGAIAQVAHWCRGQLASWSQAAAPLINLCSFPFLQTEMSHAPDSHSHPHSGAA